MSYAEYYETTLATLTKTPLDDRGFIRISAATSRSIYWDALCGELISNGFVANSQHAFCARRNINDTWSGEYDFRPTAKFLREFNK